MPKEKRPQASTESTVDRSGLLKADSDDQHKWVVMVYLAGDNNLADEMVWSLKSMAEAGDNPYFYTFARFVSRERHIPIMDFDFRGKKRHVASRGRKADPNRRSGNVIRPKIVNDLKSFVSKSIQKVSKEHKSSDPPLRFMLVLSGHSGGVHGELLPALNGDSLSICQLGEVVRHTRSEIRKLARQFPTKVRKDFKNRELDILAMDSCLMSMAEVCYEIENQPIKTKGSAKKVWRRDPAVRYLIGSEGFEMNTGWPYHRILEILQERRGISTIDFVKSIVEAYHAYYADYVLAGQSVDLSACALSEGRLDEMSKHLEKLSNTLLKAIGGNKRITEAVLLSHWRAQSYRMEQYVDLFDFCQLLSEALAVEPGSDAKLAKSIQEACSNLQTAIADESKKGLLERQKGLVKEGLVVAGDHRGPAFQHSHGVSIYFPWFGSERDLDHYRTLALPKKTKWLDFLEKFLEVTRRQPRQVRTGERLRAAFPLDNTQQFRTDPEHDLKFDPEHDPKSSSMLASTMKNPPAYFYALDKELGDILLVELAAKRISSQRGSGSRVAAGSKSLRQANSAP